ncbi:MAG: 16S rRNA (uracil(1498)-N(3))-methyltransferase [Clostridia bacterium]|nr:16S rRNA (uracil(1498)-N(3))-methyltransferase [Clostridia bacterium]
MSDFRRFFVQEIYPQTIVEGEEFFHAVNVLRIKVGEKVLLCDGTGKEYLAEISSIEKRSFTANIIEERLNECEPKEKVTLIAGYLKGDKTELVVQKAVELGVSKIVVFSSKFSSSFINENKLNRLNRVSMEAVKQCGRAIVPKVEYAETLEKALSFGDSCKNKLFACEFAKANEVDFSNLNGSTAIVVGSEGGFSNEEYQLALEKGYKTVYLGRRILRAETAGIALTSIIMHSLGEM